MDLHTIDLFSIDIHDPPPATDPPPTTDTPFAADPPPVADPLPTDPQDTPPPPLRRYRNKNSTKLPDFFYFSVFLLCC